MTGRWSGKWAGGRISRLRNGQFRWYLERRVEGRRIGIALDVESERQALAELALFERDPAAYLAVQQKPGKPIAVDAHRVEAFDRYLKDQERTLRYRRNVHRYLSDWLIDLRGRPFSELRLAELHEILNERGTARKHRIIALKSFCSWLRETGVLDRRDDPTLDLKVPPARPEIATRPKGYTLDHVASVYSAIEEQDIRDYLCVRARTGLHETELGRIVNGQALIREVWDPCGIAAVVRLLHKSGRQHLQSLDAQALGAALRLREAFEARRQKAIEHRLPMPMDSIDNARVRRCLKIASNKMGLPLIAPGELRHSFVSWREHGHLVRPTGDGVSLEDVAELIGHQSARTTSRFYDGVAVPPMMVVPLTLYHPEDPDVSQGPIEEEG